MDLDVGEALDLLPPRVKEPRHQAARGLRALALDPAGDNVAVGFGDEVHVLSTKDGATLARHRVTGSADAAEKDNPSLVADVAFSASGDRLIVRSTSIGVFPQGSLFGTLDVFPVTEGAALSVPFALDSFSERGCERFATDPSGRWLLASGGGDASVFSLERAELLFDLRALDGYQELDDGLAIAIDSSLEYAATVHGGSELVLLVFDLVSRSTLEPIVLGPHADHASVAIDAGNKRVWVAGSGGGHAVLFDVPLDGDRRAYALDHEEAQGLRPAHIDAATGAVLWRALGREVVRVVAQLPGGGAREVRLATASPRREPRASGEPLVALASSGRRIAWSLGDRRLTVREALAATQAPGCAPEARRKAGATWRGKPHEEAGELLAGFARRCLLDVAEDSMDALARRAWPKVDSVLRALREGAEAEAKEGVAELAAALAEDDAVNEIFATDDEILASIRAFA